MYYKYIILFLLFWKATFPGDHTGCFAQDVKKDLVAINKAYKSLTSFSQTLTYHYYPTHEAQKETETEIGEFKKRGNDYYQRYGSTEKLQCGNMCLVVDNSNKLIALTSAAKITRLAGFAIELDSVLKVCSSVQFNRSGKGISDYKFNFKDKEFETIQVFFNEKSHFITKIIILYQKPASNPSIKDAPRVEITYSNLNTNPSFTKDEFSTQKYFVYKNKKPVPIGKFRQYKLIQNNEFKP